MKGYRTIAFNVVTLIVTVAGVALQYVGEVGLTPRETALAAILLTVANTFGNMYLRTITTTPIGKAK